MADLPHAPQPLDPMSAALIRHIISLLGGMAVTHGLMTADQSTAISGGLMALAAIVWSLISKELAKERMADHGAAAYEAGHAAGMAEQEKNNAQ